jgi:hypothetical protein
MLEKATAYNTSICKGYSSTTRKFMEMDNNIRKGKVILIKIITKVNKR